MLPHAAFLLALQSATAAPAVEDLRVLYDVQAYRLDLAVDPRSRTLSGTVAVEAKAVGTGLSRFVLDLKPPFVVSSVVELAAPLEPRGALEGAALPFDHQGAKLSVLLPQARRDGEIVRVAVTYAGKPTAVDAFDGFHWKKTADGKPWISTSSQGTGSSAWWPCKDSFWHPEDKPERTFVNLTVPAGLVGVSNGRTTGTDTAEDGSTTSHWVHERPCETYAIAIAAAPYVVVEEELELPGAEAKLPFAYWVLPENAEKAKLQFREVPRMLEIFSKAFGPFPFPEGKFGLVETSFWGMEHSTCIAYGSSYPAWCRENGEVDPYAAMNARFDYILVHETAHEWWGNAVSAKDWGHFWIHEGFATYAEAVYLEELEGWDAAQAHMEAMRGSIGKDSKLFRGPAASHDDAYAPVIYPKGAWVLHTLRGYVDDDDAWRKALLDFNMAFRYRNATTEDFRTVLEQATGKDWKRFFEEWVYGEGYPVLDGTVTSKPKAIVVVLRSRGSGKTGFHVPIDLAWTEAGAEKEQRLEVAPGENRFEIPCKSRPKDVEILGLDAMLVESSILFE